ncbi:MAG: tetratricopeptide repeat protein, partial [Methanobrevibacter sp.]
MTYDDIIAEIKSNLTGNADKDKAYLIKQFKMHNLKEIHLELGRLLWDLMSDEEQKEYKKAVIQNIPVDEFIKSIYSYLNYGDFETALKELEDFMEILPFKFREDPQFDYFYFNNPLEEKLFRKYFKTPKQMKVIPFGDEYPRVFYLYGVVLMNLSEFDRAESALKKALSYNPVSGE